MNNKDLYNAINEVDEDILERSERQVTKSRKSMWVKWGAIAACLGAVLLLGILIKGRLRTDAPENGVTIGGVVRNYKDMTIAESTSAVLWPWEYQTIFEQYTTVVFDEKEYRTKTIGMEIEEAMLGEAIGTGEAIGYDEYPTEPVERRMSVEVRQIAGISEEKLIAVNLDGAYYTFAYGEYLPPESFGEVLEDYNLAEVLEFERFSVYEAGKEKGYYSLNDDAVLWQLLSSCREAKFVEEDAWNRKDSRYISFTATSEALGVYKRVFYVAENGLIRTNIFDWAYTFDIGAEVAGEIIAYATENATEAEREPYAASIAGTLVEIGDGYILVDDTVLCENPEEGMIFKVLTDDLRVSRSIDYLKIKTGSVVVVYFTGDIDVAAGNVISGAYSLDKGTIYDGEVMIPE